MNLTFLYIKENNHLVTMLKQTALTLVTEYRIISKCGLLIAFNVFELIS